MKENVKIQLELHADTGRGFMPVTVFETEIPWQLETVLRKCDLVDAIMYPYRLAEMLDSRSKAQEVYKSAINSYDSVGTRLFDYENEIISLGFDYLNIVELIESYVEALFKFPAATVKSSNEPFHDL